MTNKSQFGKLNPITRHGWCASPNSLKTHAIFAKTMNYDWAKMNNTGCSLVYGHPQAPTLTRIIIEALEEAVDLGGGYVLVFGCAAGDVGTAGIFRVS